MTPDKPSLSDRCRQFISECDDRWGDPINKHDLKAYQLACECGNPSSHRVWDKHQCCACYVLDGNPPADWHPICMAVYRALTGES